MLALPKVDPAIFNALAWVYFIGDPLVGNQNDLVGATLTWLKAVGLICLVSWLFAWLVGGSKERIIARGEWFDYVGIIGLVLIPTNVLLRQMELMGRHRHARDRPGPAGDGAVAGLRPDDRDLDRDGPLADDPPAGRAARRDRARRRPDLAGGRPGAGPLDAARGLPALPAGRVQPVQSAHRPADLDRRPGPRAADGPDVHGLRGLPADRRAVPQRGAARAAPSAFRDRAALGPRGQPADVGALGGHHDVPAGPGVLPLVHPGTAGRRDGPALRRLADAA